ncbi:MAG: glycine cleavage system protein GcvH [Planctomycetota bacterium]
MKRPAKARYAKTHEWALLDGDTLTLGVTDWAVEHLGDIVYVDLPEAGKEIAPGDTVCEIESVKAVGEVYAPVAGTVEAVNSGLSEDAAPLAKDPYGEGWLVKLRVADPAPLQDLMDVAAYEKHIESAEPG